MFVLTYENANIDQITSYLRKTLKTNRHNLISTNMNLRYAFFANITMLKCAIINKNFLNTNLTQSCIKHSNFYNGNFQNSTMKYCLISQSSFELANFSNAHVIHSTIIDVDFRYTNLHKINFESTTLENCVFSNNFNELIANAESLKACIVKVNNKDYANILRKKGAITNVKDLSEYLRILCNNLCAIIANSLIEDLEHNGSIDLISMTQLNNMGYQLQLPISASELRIIRNNIRINTEIDLNYFKMVKYFNKEELSQYPEIEKYCSFIEKNKSFMQEIVKSINIKKIELNNIIKENNLKKAKSFFLEHPKVLKISKFSKMHILHMAIKNNNKQLAEILITNGANVNQKQLGNTPLHLEIMSIKNKNPRNDRRINLGMTDLLLKNGASLYIPNDEKNTILELVNDTSNSQYNLQIIQKLNAPANKEMRNFVKLIEN